MPGQEIAQMNYGRSSHGHDKDSNYWIVAETDSLFSDLRHQKSRKAEEVAPRCPFCSQKDKTIKLRLYQVDDNLAQYLCPTEDCLYPYIGRENGEPVIQLVKRRKEDIPIPCSFDVPSSVHSVQAEEERLPPMQTRSNTLRTPHPPVLEEEKDEKDFFGVGPLESSCLPIASPSQELPGESPTAETKVFAGFSMVQNPGSVKCQANPISGAALADALSDSESKAKHLPSLPLAPSLSLKPREEKPSQPDTVVVPFEMESSEYPKEVLGITESGIPESAEQSEKEVIKEASIPNNSILLCNLLISPVQKEKSPSPMKSSLVRVAGQNAGPPPKSPFKSPIGSSKFAGYVSPKHSPVKLPVISSLKSLVCSPVKSPVAKTPTRSPMKSETDFSIQSPQKTLFDLNALTEDMGFPAESGSPKKCRVRTDSVNSIEAQEELIRLLEDKTDSSPAVIRTELGLEKANTDFIAKKLESGDRDEILKKLDVPDSSSKHPETQSENVVEATICVNIGHTENSLVPSQCSAGPGRVSRERETSSRSSGSSGNKIDLVTLEEKERRKAVQMKRVQKKKLPPNANKPKRLKIDDAKIKEMQQKVAIFDCAKKLDSDSSEILSAKLPVVGPLNDCLILRRKRVRDSGEPLVRTDNAAHLEVSSITQNPKSDNGHTNGLVNGVAQNMISLQDFSGGNKTFGEYPSRTPALPDSQTNFAGYSLRKANMAHLSNGRTRTPSPSTSIPAQSGQSSGRIDVLLKRKALQNRIVRNRSAANLQAMPTMQQNHRFARFGMTHSATQPVLSNPGPAQMISNEQVLSNWGSVQVPYNTLPGVSGSLQGNVYLAEMYEPFQPIDPALLANGMSGSGVQASPSQPPSFPVPTSTHLTDIQPVLTGYVGDLNQGSSQISPGMYQMPPDPQMGIITDYNIPNSQDLQAGIADFEDSELADYFDL